MLKIWAYNVLACTLYFLGDFETSGQNAVHGVRIWRSGNVQALPEDVDTPIVSCLKQVASSYAEYGRQKANGWEDVDSGYHFDNCLERLPWVGPTRSSPIGRPPPASW